MLSLARKDPQTEIALQSVAADCIPQLIDLHRVAFAPEQVACTIYACAGVDRYLASLTAFPRHQREHELWGAWRGRDLVGYAHFRALPDSWHLNNIAVHPACQGQGIGSRLWSAFCAAARRRDYQRLTLDVESDNQPAVEWYCRHGLEVSGATWRYEKPIHPGEHPEPPARDLRLVGWDQAQAWQLAYGFSQFEIHWADQSWTVGRIGTRYFKAGGPLPGAVEAALSQIDPARSLLVFSQAPLSSSGYRFLGKSLRMSGGLPAEER